ncbi:hypothetical protein ADIS_1653 [Lunatimonas lonarensis]|uniref:DUF1349 domain-containing protein n=1 Tax=Lunatimonas lonarensis TaxID=1232681 RepID=R7ZUS9_9BACT|nr:DUF1349 domain-containing protein [Lunatimonas lonarensis]EON77734.1 hypothetical protein ADIS_1653 [Lunatimonas lonarensis]
MLEQFTWINEPKHWEITEGTCHMSTDPKTDFWRKTHYGFVRDNGHFLYTELFGSFEMKVKITGSYRDLYDQAGLMLRQDEANWLKTGIEYVHGQQQVSAVVTRNYSDWSVSPYAGNPPHLWLRLTREGDFVEIHYSPDNIRYDLLRIAYMTPSESIFAGLMAASPDGEGFDVAFSDLQITQ